MPGFGILKQNGGEIGIESMLGIRDAKNNHRDNGIGLDIIARKQNKRMQHYHLKVFKNSCLPFIFRKHYMHAYKVIIYRITSTVIYYPCLVYAGMIIAVWRSKLEL